MQSSLERVHGTLALRPIGVRTLIVINEGINSGIFTGYSEGSWAIQDSHDMKFIDVNSDGNLDLFVGHDTRYGVYINDAPPIQIALDKAVTTTPSRTGDVVFFQTNLISGLANSYFWEFGDGTSLTTSEPQAQHTYIDAGSYSITVTASGPIGSDQLNFKQTIHNPLTTNSPLSSSGIAYQPLNSSDDLIFVANPDHDSVSVLSSTTGERLREIAVGVEPRSLSLGSNSRLYVVNKGDATLTVINTETLQVVERQELPYASRPHGIVVDTQLNTAYIALEAKHQILKWDVLRGESLGFFNTNAVPRELALSADRSNLYAPIFITPPLIGESSRTVGSAPSAKVLVVDSETLTLIASIGIDVNDISGDDEDAELSSRGIPNYLRAPAISPDGLTAVIPAKIDNVFRGLMRDGRARAHDKLVRGSMLKLATDSNIEVLSDRVDFDNNSAPTALAYGPTGNFIFSVHESSRAFVIIDAFTNDELFRATTEFAPRSLVVSPDGFRLYIHNFLSRSVSIYDTSDIMTGRGTGAELVGVTAVTTEEKLSPQVLRGKQLFHDSEDNRLSTQAYIACSSCHDDAGHDGRVWDFSDAGEGLRNTIDLRGRAAIGNGNVHWSANFDEFHDFENDIREIFDGTGLLSDADFAQSAAPLDSLNPKAGRSDDLDALAAYGASLNSYHQSPNRQANGQLTNAGIRGKQLFMDYSCATCHSGTSFTDSPEGLTHDVGTIDMDTGGRLGMPLLNGGLDTPTLRGLWDGAPYLHDGSAQTVQDAVLAHTKNVATSHSNLSANELDDLASYIMQIDHNEIIAPENLDTNETTSAPLSNAYSNVVNVDGDLELSVTDLDINDWSNVEPYPADSTDTFTGENSLDINRVWLAHDERNLYIRYETENPVVNTWGLSLHFDTDNDKGTGFTGFSDELPIGIDYMIEGELLYQYSGTGNNFAWRPIQALENSIMDTNRELMVPRLAIGNPIGMRLFIYADNAAVGGSAVDAYPNSMADDTQELEDRSFAYSFGQATDITIDPPEASPNVISVNNFVSTITLDGNLQEWLPLESFGQDANDVRGADNTIDWLETWMAHNNESLYIAWRNDGPVSLTWGNGIMLDTDQNINTGYVGFQNNMPIGVDRLIEDSSVYQYTGRGSDWQWNYIGEVDIALGSNSVEMAIPLNFVNSNTAMDLFFVGNNAALGGNAVDFYPDNVLGNTGDNSGRHVRYSLVPTTDNAGSSLRSSGMKTGSTEYGLDNSRGSGSIGWLWLLVGLSVVGQRAVLQLFSRRRLVHTTHAAPTRYCLALFACLLLSACGEVTIGGVSGNSSAITPDNTMSGNSSQPLNNPSMPSSAQLAAAVSSLDYINTMSEIRLTGSLMNPPVATRSQATASIVVNSVSRMITGSLIHNVTAATEANIHVGLQDENGPVVIAMTAVDQNEFNIPADTFLTDAQIADYNAGNYYIVISSAEHTTGEVRAQISQTQAMIQVSPNLDDIQAKVISPVCSGCHFGGGETLPSSMDLTSADSTYNALINNFSIQEPNKLRILPGISVESYLLQKLEGNQKVGSQMPFRGIPLDDEVLNAIKTWIDDGANRS